MEHLLGIDLGGSSVKALAVSPEGEQMLVRQVGFDSDQPLEWAQHVRSLVPEIESKLGGQAASIGLSAPGLAAADARSIRHMPGRLQGLEDFDWTEYLGRKRLIPVMNDAHAALAGESWVGAVRNIRNVVFVTLGTGVGGAVMVDGNILRGAIGRAGHVGHICLDPMGEPDICRTPGSLELAIGNCTIERRTQGKYSATHELVGAVRNGDREAAEIWRDSVRNLACGLTSLTNVLDPEVIIIGGGIAQAGDVLFEPLQEFMDAMEWVVSGYRVRIEPAQLGEMAGAYGAAITGFRRNGV